MPFLLCVEGYHEGFEWPIGDDPVIIGRGKDIDVSLRDMKVSRRHARIFRNGVRFFIEDLGSTNGTYLDRQKITKLALLQNEQFFQVGESLLLFTEKSLREKAGSPIYQTGAEVFEKGHQYQELLAGLVQEIIQKKKGAGTPKQTVKPGSLQWLLREFKKGGKENLSEEGKKPGK